ncbi:MAG: hypothetical protein JWP38_3754 [Herbaspirillum sp.]|nr:hypothetical protein [Herbaspirillum sp.]
MQISQLPVRVPLPFATSGSKNTIPTASQIGITPGAASLTDGFPPVTLTPIASGGVAPSGLDFNGIFNLITAVQQWQCAGGAFKYDAAFSTSVGGYPKGAVLLNVAGDGYWICLADNNTTNPDATDGSSANWAPVDSYGATTIPLTNANVTLTPAQFSKSIIILTGALTGNVQLTMPKLVGQWYVLNATTGVFTTSVLTASGTPVIVLQGGGAWLRGDGTNVLNDALQVGPASQSKHAMQFGQVSGVVGSTRNLFSKVDAASATKTVAADEIIVETALGGLRYCLSSFNKTGNLATVGAGGMDTGTAPASGFVAEYTIYNPNAALSATNPSLLYVSATSTVAPNVYGGANMPAGYTASALVSVWATNGSGQFVVGAQRDRSIDTAPITILNTSTLSGSLASLSISGAVPLNAITCKTAIQLGNTATSTMNLTIASSAANIGFKNVAGTVSAGFTIATSIPEIILTTPQTLFYSNANSAGTPNFFAAITGYSF